VLITITSEFENVRIITVLETEEHVLAIAKKPVLAIPSLSAESAKFPPEFILNYQYSIFVVSAVCVKCDETASILVHFVNSFPITSPVKGR
jgi:hypothetical protein